MRFGFGLIALLIGVGIYLYLSAESAQKVTKASKPARAVAEEVAGVGMKDSFIVEPVESNGRVTGLEIKMLDPAGPLAKMYAVQAGDIITVVGPFAVRDTDVESVKAQLWELGMRQHKLTVLRGTQRLELENRGEAAKMGGGGLGGVTIPSH